ncbi:MAG TPA: pilus assembly protein TadG-related protein [Xanthobacteraceae bacterium]|nr:pilus assembly protein TadG-related protein [Xanthobacteraceae bacterium]
MVKAVLNALVRGARLAQARALILSFGRNRRGNVAVISALATLPMVAAAGCVIDYTTATTIKTKLQAAADAASLATVSINSSVITTAKNMTGSGTVSGGSTYAVNFFNANLTQAPENTGYTNLTPTATVARSNLTITATVSYTAQVPTYFMGLMGFKNIPLSGTSKASYTMPTFINFYLMLDVSGSMSFPSTTAEMYRLMAVNPDNLHPSNSPPNGGYPQGCQFACHWASQNTTCGQTEAQTGSYGPWQGSWPPSVQQYGGTGLVISSQWPSGYPGGYCLGFIISRLGTTPTSFASGCTNDGSTPSAPSGNIPGTRTAYPSGCGQYVNWTNSQVTSCSTPGTTSCIQLRADAIGYAVNALLSEAATTESSDGIANQFQVGLFPFIQNLCTASANNSNSCSVGLTTSLTGATITNFAAELANLLDTGNNSTLGSGGTHLENALSEMNSFITSVGSGSSSSNGLPYVFIVTDGSQDYQTQWNDNWGSQNWTATASVPYPNSATVMPPNSESSTNYCTTMKNRGITIAILYIPYATIVNPNTAFANDEDGYANANIANIPASLQSCASPNFFYTANTPTDIQNALITMFEQAVSTAHITN